MSRATAATISNGVARVEPDPSPDTGTILRRVGEQRQQLLGFNEGTEREAAPFPLRYEALSPRFPWRLAFPIAAVAAVVCGRAPARVSGVHVYASNEEGGDVVVIDPDAGKVLERIPVGKRPRALRLTREGTALLVALSGSPIHTPGVDDTTLPPPDRAADGIGLV